MRARIRLATALAVVLAASCSDDSSPTDAGDGDGAAAATSTKLEGTWRASGTDESLGDVTVQLTFEADGRLAIALLLEGGGRLNFGGTWVLEGDRLILTGAYFLPEGMTQVTCEARGDSLLLLRDESGGEATAYRR